MSLRASPGEYEAKNRCAQGLIESSGFLVFGVSSTGQSRSSFPKLINS
ncbi:hypothetical protein [Microcoleus sp. herbarium2]